MDSKVRDRRRRIYRERGRRRGGVVALVVVILILLLGFVWLRSSGVFAVKKVTTTKLENVSAESISRATSAAAGANLLNLDTDEIEKSLLALPYVKSATTHRRFPNTLELVLTEYQPLVNIRASDGSTWLVSVEGRVLEKKSQAGLPLVITDTQTLPTAGKSVPVFVVKALPVAALVTDRSVVGNLPAVTQIAVTHLGRVSIMLEGQIEIRLGETQELKQKLKVAAEIVEQYLRAEKQVEYIDVSVPEKAAVKDK